MFQEKDIPGLIYISPEFNRDKVHEYNFVVKIEPHGYTYLIGNKAAGKLLLLASNATKKENDRGTFSELALLSEECPFINKEFNSTSVLIVNRKVTLVPFTLFNPDEKDNYLSFNIDLESEDEVFSSPVPLIKAACIFAVPGKLHYQLTKILSEPTFHHLAEVSINQYPQSERITSDKARCFLHFSGNTFFVHLMRNNELVFFNVFQFDTPEEFIYYVLNIAGKVSVTSENTGFILSGDIDKEMETCKQLRSSFKHIQYAGIPSALKLPDADIQKILPWHRYNDLLNLFCCEL